jgi:hypothetical protein
MLRIGHGAWGYDQIVVGQSGGGRADDCSFWNFGSSGEIVGRSGSGTHRNMLTNREFLLSSTRHVFARRFATEPQDSKTRSGSFPLAGGRLGWGSSAWLRVSTPIPTFPLGGGRSLIPPKDAARGVPREEVMPTNFAEEPEFPPLHLPSVCEGGDGPAAGGAVVPQGLASRIRLKGVSVARRKWRKPPEVTTSRSLPSPACAPRAAPTSWSSEAGTQTSVEAA